MAPDGGVLVRAAEGNVYYFVRCGFDVVLEQYDHWSELYDHLATVYPRCFIASVKSAGLRGIAGRQRA